ncbi:YfjI family protein [Ectothiorhodospira haloalkaliphila]|uniref:YfjI family protein n=1 Tax=Ectothiorhodospira haloalkaliphila TaxID=421628 RepID=UPI00047A447C|nr:YfjI family protein [Ectothiorhodospira haloalkaliphila]
MQYSNVYYTSMTPVAYPFPEVQSGGVLQERVRQIIDITNAPPPLVAQGGLAIASCLIQNLVDVAKPNGQLIPPSLYLIGVAESGERKTTVDSLVFHRFDELEANQDHKFAEAVAAYELELRIWQAKNKLLFRDLAREDEEQVIGELYQHQQLKPVAPQRSGMRTLTDVTPAAAIDVFRREAVKSTILRSSEGEEVLSGAAVQRLSIWNSLWGGDPVRVDRKTGGNCVVNPRTTLYVQAQPQVMQKFVGKGGENARGIGFFARALITYPASTQGMRPVTEVGDARNSEYDEWVEALFLKNIEMLSKSDFTRTIIEFSDDAKGRWFVVANDIERAICPGGRFEGHGDHASKLADNIARMAVLLHCAEYGLEGKVSLRTLDDAILICFWFSNEFLRLFGRPSEEYRDYLLLLDWLCQKRAEGFRYLRKNHVRQYGPYALRKSGKLNLLLNWMASTGEIGIGLVTKKTIIDLYPGYAHDQWQLMSVAQ